MDTQSGLPLLVQQFKALFVKNFLLSWRHKGFMFAQLISPLVFLLLLFAVEKSADPSAKGKPLYDPVALTSLPIPPCEAKFYTTPPCYDFAWSGNASSKIASIVGQIMANNPGRPIPISKVKSFDTKKEVDEWLFNNPMRCPGVLHFQEKSATVIGYGIQTNSTQVDKRGQFEDVTFKYQIPLQIAAEREIARSFIGGPNFGSWVVGLKEFAHPAIFASGFSWTKVLLPSAGPLFLLAITIFPFVFQISSLVTEKELKLRQAMTIMCLYDTAYWLSWLVWETTFALLLSLVTVLLGRIFRLPLFLSNSFLIVFPVFFLFQISMNDIFKMYIATFFLWFLVAIYLDNILPNSSGVRKSIFYFLNPGYWTGKGGDKIEEGGIFSWLHSIPQVEHKTPDDEDVFEEENIVKHQATEDLVDPNVVVQIRGLIKTYPGKIKIGCGKCTRKSHFHAVKGLWVNIPKDQLFCILGPNGAGKTTTISCLTGLCPATSGDGNLSINFLNSYVHGLQISSDKASMNQIPNHRASSSLTALIYGHSIRNSVGMSNIRKLIGVCPQFDTLWDALSAEEHLYLFASIKGIPATSIKSVVQKSIADVKLTYAAKGRARGYSGGMKRRLSVAIALIGDPKLVILDEPTTGMDPITRRHVWDIIEDAKKGRAIILTTHSMEEADILSDRIGIVVKGTLRCIGNSTRLKSKFGCGFITNVSFSETNMDAAESSRQALRNFFKQHLNVVPKEETKYFVSYVIPQKEGSNLMNFFAELQEREKEFGISDIQLNLTTLEDVFLNVTKKAALENAVVESNMTTLTLESGESLLIPVGAEKIGIPGSVNLQNRNGLMVEVYWGQGSDSNLCITGHSDETPIPDELFFKLPPSLLAGNPCHGLVLDF
ncbi:hypothetical protein Vadar_028082 [Vaccinium darrowii]|uniref:Uncharacterized protein n=1 Tax=Vaccinium darrowii TaxID=229202 RepID=A0ACB7Y2C5_9ERIC|nr:hypothetical protein Vadar_028082 [Vaccinium darrowii]